MKGYIIALLMLLSFLFTVSVYAESLSLDKVDPLYVVWAEGNGEDSEIYICKRELGKWLGKEQLTDNDTADFSPYIALDKDGNPWIVWIEDDGVNTAVYSRYWNGKAWSNIYQVDSVDLFSDTFPSITIDNKNVPYVVWSGSDGKDDDVYISSWNGLRWEPEEMINIDDNSPDFMPVVTEQPGKDELIISWMGYNGKRYELYYTLYSKSKISDGEKVFGFDKAYSFGECPSFIKSAKGDVELYWWERGTCHCVKGNGINWNDEESIDLKCKDTFIVDLLARLDTPICVSWIESGIRQSFRLLPMSSSFVQKGWVSKLRVFVKIFSTRLSFLCYIFDIFSSNLYAETTTIKYIGFGDSITLGDEGWEGYIPRLDRKLNAELEPSVVYNAGVGGERTWEGLDRMDSVLEKYSADYILIMEGTNDITWQYNPGSIAFNLGLMVDKCIAYGTTPLLANVPPRRDSLQPRTRDSFNPAIEEIAREKNVTFVDQYTPLAVDVEANIADHVHPSDVGTEIMMNTWYDAIYSLRKPPEPEGDDGGCGSIVLPAAKGGGRGINLGVLFVLFMLGLWFRVRLCRS